uniref:protein phosphatase 1 regulatory subunit 29-like n=1 Tax=Myxine glutinosa TaxID=7769 RepID=UPI00358EF80C
MPPYCLFTALPLLLLLRGASLAAGECWFLEGHHNFVWQAICSQNQPPYEAIPTHINSTVLDIKLNDNKIKTVTVSSLKNFVNLTQLDLTRNEIETIEEGAFGHNENLRILNISYNHLVNLTDGMFWGLGQLEQLYLQGNLLETIAASVFQDCLSLVHVNLSSNHLAVLSSAVFQHLSMLRVLQLYNNPFDCTCLLLPFLKWLQRLRNVSAYHELMKCEMPHKYIGYQLVARPDSSTEAIAYNLLSVSCIDHHNYQKPTYPPWKSSTTEECGLNRYCSSATGPRHVFEPVESKNDHLKPDIRLNSTAPTKVTLLIHIPDPFSKMYVLVNVHNETHYEDIKNLNKRRETYTAKGLRPCTNYTFCVAFIKNAQRDPQNCVWFKTENWKESKSASNSSAMTHYIMTILGCLFGMVIVLSVIYYCLRRRRKEEEKHTKSITLKSSLADLKQGSQTETGGAYQLLPSKSEQTTPTTMISIKSALQTDLDVVKAQDANETPRTAKGNYLDVRTVEKRDGHSLDKRDSVTEIATIAKEVDKVNQIINNCIDALKSDAVTFASAGEPSTSTVPLTVSAASRPLQGRSREEQATFSPPPLLHAESFYPVQKNLPLERSPRRPSTTSARTLRSIYSESSFGPTSHSEEHYTDKVVVRPPRPPDRPSIVPKSGFSQLEVQPLELHRHSYPGPQYQLPVPQASQLPPVHSPSLLQTMPHPRALAGAPASGLAGYYQLSPREQRSGYFSSPEYSARNAQKIWVRFKPYHKKLERDQEKMAAGHALKMKVQLATDEDLHEILDYWKGVSAQQKS